MIICKIIVDLSRWEIGLKTEAGFVENRSIQAEDVNFMLLLSPQIILSL